MPWMRDASSGMSRSGSIRAWKCRPVGRSLTSSSAATSITRSPESGSRPVVSVSNRTERVMDAGLGSGGAARAARGGGTVRSGSPHRRAAASPRSGICRAITASMSAVLMRRRRRTRCICTARGADTTTTWSTRRSPPVSSSSGMSSTTARRPGAAGAAEEGAFLLLDHRVQDGSSRFERVRLAEHRLARSAARSTAPSAPCRGMRRRSARTARPPLRLQPVDRGVGVEHRDACAAEGRGRGGLAHADAAGQADDLHRRQQVRGDEAAQLFIHHRRRRRTRRAKPGTAWCSSMPRPSTARRPARAGAASSGVSSGT